MPVGLYKAVIQLPSQSGMPEDDIINDLYFFSDIAGDSHNDAADNLQVRLAAFYNAVGTGAIDDLANFMGDQVTRAASGCAFNFYYQDFVSPPALWGSPVAVRNWTLDAGASSTNLPTEVAVVASFHGDLTNVPETEANPSPPPAIIRPAARKRGRIYLGPFMINGGVESGPSNDLAPNAALRNTITGACVDLMGANDDYEWVVYSPTTPAVWTVVGGYIDNAFDTQRRRGTAPTDRSDWP